MTTRAPAVLKSQTKLHTNCSPKAKCLDQPLKLNYVLKMENVENSTILQTWLKILLKWFTKWHFPRKLVPQGMVIRKTKKIVLWMTGASQAVEILWGMRHKVCILPAMSICIKYTASLQLLKNFLSPLPTLSWCVLPAFHFVPKWANSAIRWFF